MVREGSLVLRTGCVVADDTGLERATFMKDLLKKVIYRVGTKSYEDIIANIERKSVVSFDVFNTLVRRDVIHPEDVFGIIEQKLPAEFQIDHFKAKRVRAEQLARKKDPGHEVHLDEIYGFFAVDAAVKKRLIEIECEEEIFISTQNIALKRIYDYCIREGKKVYFISDMYLPTETVEQILRKNGYTEGKLYVSSESRKMKKNGELFQLVVTQEAIHTSEWIHLGDSIISDYFQPKRLGLEALLIEQNPKHFGYVDKRLIKKDQSYEQLITFINNRILSYTDPYMIIGYGVLGPLLYGFSRWLEEKIPDEKQIVFLAREGALLQKAFSIVSDRPSIYMHISRHAAYEAFLDHSPKPEDALLGKIRVLKVICSKEEFARSCGLSDEEIATIFYENHIQKEELCPRLEDKKAVLDIIWPLVKKKTSGQYNMMEQYLQELGIKGDCSVVDVGWRGTIQAILDGLGFVMDGKTVKWDGYYMGCREYKTNDSASYYQHIDKQGYLFDSSQNRRNQDTVSNSVSFFELLFLSTEGTTKHYTEDTEGHVVPVLGQPDNPPVISCIIEKIQNAGIQFLEEIHKLSFPVSLDAAFAGYKIIARVPSWNTLELFKDFSAYDEHSYSLANDHSLGYYLVHPRQFMKEFAKKPNRAWFLKGVFKLPLPYVVFLNFLKIFFDEK